jgi:hypothetical protein
VVAPRGCCRPADRNAVQERPVAARAAGPLSPLTLKEPLPATVEMMPSGPMRRSRRLLLSAMYTLPSDATASCRELESFAWVAGPPSPLKPCIPFPAKVVMMPGVNPSDSVIAVGDVQRAVGRTAIRREVDLCLGSRRHRRCSPRFRCPPQEQWSRPNRLRTMRVLAAT